MNPLSENMKRRLRNYIISGARNYNKYLADKVFKIVCEDGDTVEIRFFISDFKHLTGLYSDLKNNEFYKECIHGTISIGNINTKQKYDWNTLRTKCRFIENIHELLYKDCQKVLVLKMLDTKTVVFPYAVKNLSNNICVGFVSDINKARSLFQSEKNIIAIFAKNSDQLKYHQLIYISDVISAYEKDDKLLDTLEESIQMKFLDIITKP